MTTPQTTIDHALAYLARGWAVLPLHDVTGGTCSCGSADPRHAADGGGKHPLHKGWQNAGVSDAAQVREIWASRPGANIGIVTGVRSGIWVLDVDPLHGGDRQIAGLVAAFGVLPDTYAVTTGSGGTHYYWRMPEHDLTNSRGRLPLGLDVRANGGQVVAPPSRTLRGAYAVGADIAVADAPGWLLDMVKPEPVRPSEAMGAPLIPVAGPPGVGRETVGFDRGAAYARTAVTELLGQLAGAQPGERNNTAARIGRRLAELVNADWARLDPDEVWASYMHAAAIADVDGAFSQSEAYDVLVGAVRAVAGRPAILPPADFLGTTWFPAVTETDQSQQSPTPAPAVVIDDAFENAVRFEMGRQIVRSEATRRIARTEFIRTWHAPASLGSLADELLMPDEPLQWRVHGLLPLGGNAVLVAPRKTGKTTLVGALVASLVDGEPFLGRYATAPLRGAVAIFNYENTPRQQRRWLRDLAIGHPEQVHVLHLRGTHLPLNVPQVREFVVGWLRERGIEVWIPDPYARAGQGVVLNENDNGQANVFTGLLDEIKHESGIAEIIMPAHSTNKGDVEIGAETARGAGRLEDWADALWYLNAVEGQRFLRATGRDVDIAETHLIYDSTTRQLTAPSAGLGRIEVAQSADASIVAEVLRRWEDSQPATRNDLADACGGWGKVRVGKAVDYLVSRNLAWVERGPNRAMYHHLGPKPILGGTSSGPAVVP